MLNEGGNEIWLANPIIEAQNYSQKHVSLNDNQTSYLDFTYLLLINDAVIILYILFLRSFHKVGVFMIVVLNSLD